MKVKSNATRMDMCGEIIDLWHEVTYLRMVLGSVLSTVTDGEPDKDQMLNELFQKCKEEAQIIVREKFPNANIEYCDDKEKEDK